MTGKIFTPAPPKPLVHFSGGEPNAPAGEPRFVPLNPWGRGFPKPPRPEKQPLAQVVVKDRRDGNRELRVGPQMAEEFAEMLCLTIREQVANGAERQWHSPRVVVTQVPDMGRPVRMEF